MHPKQRCQKRKRNITWLKIIIRLEKNRISDHTDIPSLLKQLINPRLRRNPVFFFFFPQGTTFSKRLQNILS